MFNCCALTHYEQAKRLVESTRTDQEPLFTADMSFDEKMDLVLVPTLPTHLNKASAHTDDHEKMQSHGPRKEVLPTSSDLHAR